MKMIKKIVVTGGPCAGKTAAMPRLREELTAAGYTVVTVPESATEVLGEGFTPVTCGSVLAFQKRVMTRLLEKERRYDLEAERLASERVVMIFDRGTLDCASYLTKDEYAELLRFSGITAEEALYRYDAVFHLVSAAKGAPEFYSREGNSVRMESCEEAVVSDDRLIEVWRRHPRFEVIDNSTGFDEKITRLINAILSYLKKENF